MRLGSHFGTDVPQAYDAYEHRVLKKQSWNSLLIRLHKLSKGKSDLGFYASAKLTPSLAQSQSIIVSTFFEALTSDNTLSGPLKSILWDLYRLFALYTMEGEGYECEDLQSPLSLTND